MRNRLLVGTLLLASILQSMSVRADDIALETKPSTLRSVFWLSASATFLSAGLAGLYALRVSAIYDRSQSLPAVSPEIVTLRHDAERAERTADALFITTALFATTSVILLIATVRQESVPRRPRATLSAAASPHGATLVLQGQWL